MDKKGLCCFCNKEYDNFGNDIRPLVTYALNNDRCCDFCNSTIVIPNRLKFWTGLHGFAIKNKTTEKFLRHSGLEIEDTSTLIEDPILIFYTEAEAQHHIEIDQLINCEPVRIQIREDN